MGNVHRISHPHAAHLLKKEKARGNPGRRKEKQMKLQPFVKVLGVPWFYPQPKQPEAAAKIAPVGKKYLRSDSWTAEGERKLKRFYPTTMTDDLVEMFGFRRSRKSIIERARVLGLKKTPATLYKIKHQSQRKKNDLADRP